jgi:hypothetical protein
MVLVQLARADDPRFTTSPSILVSTTPRTLALTDVGYTLASTLNTPASIVVPPHVQVALPLGVVVPIEQHGTGVVTVTAGAGVTLRSLSGTFVTPGQWGGITLRQHSTDLWVAI